MQYCLKPSSIAQNPAYSRVFAGKFKLAFDRKPNQIPPVQPDLNATDFKQKDTVQSLDYIFTFLSHSHHCKALNSLICADVMSRNYSLTHWVTGRSSGLCK